MAAVSPRPRQAAGRPHTPVIPTSWETAHRHVATGTHRGTVSVRRPGTATYWNEATEQNEVGAHPPYLVDEPARVLRLDSRTRTVVVADDPEQVAEYRIALDADVTVANGHLVTVTAAADPSLVDLVLQVVHVVHGTERFERHLYCTLV